jgi:phage terminase small subunit
MSAQVTLTAKQARFVDEYLIDGNGAAAAVRAGYSKQSARSIAAENLAKHDVLEVLRHRQAELCTELQVTRHDVIRGLAEAFEMAKQDRNPGAMITAMTSMAKLLGFDKPEAKSVVISGENARLRAQFEAMSDEELMAIAAGTVAT